MYLQYNPFCFSIKEQQILRVLFTEQLLTEAFCYGSEHLCIQAGSDKALMRVKKDLIIP